MAEKTATDLFTERAMIDINVDHTLTDVYSKLWDFGISSRDLVAMVISRVDIIFGSFAAQTDQAFIAGCGLFGKSVLASTLSVNFLENPACYWHYQMEENLSTSGQSQREPFTFDFSGLPGAGILIPARPLYIASWSSGLAGDKIFQVDMRYRLVPMDQTNYLDLIQTMLGVGLSP